MSGRFLVSVLACLDDLIAVGLRREFLTAGFLVVPAEATLRVLGVREVALYLFVMGAEFLECLLEGRRTGLRQSGHATGRPGGLFGCFARLI